jgi:hypothetical protein
VWLCQLSQLARTLSFVFGNLFVTHNVVICATPPDALHLPFILQSFFACLLLSPAKRVENFKSFLRFALFAIVLDLTAAERVKKEEEAKKLAVETAAIKFIMARRKLMLVVVGSQPQSAQREIQCAASKRNFLQLLTRSHSISHFARQDSLECFRFHCSPQSHRQVHSIRNGRAAKAAKKNVYN